ncbi:unnamed protein product [Rotaria sordida]|uniref:Uncharacterized protein n=1 Tax=Rotaria sordida TaxID=392033 RepID=A0A815M3F6_9BILA|nr:unnamed protein product [Rotaria sordida]CAF1629658.1 unnamed protein product [Rotaria sordida]
MEGKGVKTYADGGSYDGDWHNDSFHGQGVRKWADGDGYSGSWINGKRTGHGVWTWASGDQYDGEWHEDVRTGYGIYKWPSGDVYRGNWVAGNMEGKGVKIYGDGGSYDGDWHNGFFHGQGVRKWANGNEYYGDWNLPKKTLPSDLQSEIEQFFNRDDVSKPCPDKKKHINGHQIRYRLNHITVLHQQFEVNIKIDIDYDTFCRYVPAYIKKPNHDSWGTCLCVLCLNPEMKFEKLQHLKQKFPRIKTALDGLPSDLSTIIKDDDQKKRISTKFNGIERGKYQFIIF